MFIRRRVGWGFEAALAVAGIAWTIHVAQRFQAAAPMSTAWPRVLVTAATECVAGPHEHWVGNTLTSLGAVASFVAMIAWLFVLGDPIARRWFAHFTPLDRWLVRLASGVLVAHLLIFALGVLGMWSVWGLRALVGLSLLVAAVHHLLRGARPTFDPKSVRRAMTGGHVMGLVALLWIAWAGVEGLAPETGADAGIYHVGVANTWLLDGGIHFIPDHYASNLPLPQSMLYALLLAIGPANATGAMQPALLFVAAIAMHRIVVDAIGEPAVPFAVWCVLAVPALNGYLAISGNDQFTIALFALGVWLLLRSLSAPRDENATLYLGAACLGGAMSAKYTAWGFVGLAAIYFAVEWWLRCRTLRPVVGAFVLLLVAPGVWAVKAAVVTGNPVFPALRGVFGTAHTYPPGIERAIASNESKLAALSDLFAWPSAMTFETPSLMHNLGPHWLVLVPLSIVAAVLVVSDRRRALRLLAFLLGGWLIWAYTFTNARYAGPLFVASGIALSVVLNLALRARSRAPHLWSAAILSLLVWTTFIGWGYRVSLVRPHTYVCGNYDALGYVTQEGLDMTVAPPEPLYAWLDNHLDPDTDRVLVIGESRTGSLAIPYISGDEYDRPVFRRYVASANTPDEVRERLAADGVTHIALNLAAGRMYEGFSFHILTLEPELERRWAAFFRTTDLRVHHVEARQDWAVTKILDPGVAPSNPAPDLVGAALGR